jgi:hypothetical protein
MEKRQNLLPKLNGWLFANWVNFFPIIAKNLRLLQTPFIFGGIIWIEQLP